MSKKWERNGGREGGRGERWRESFAQERRELSDMGEHIFHVSRHRKCLRVLAPFPFATRLGGREITGNVQARGGKRSLILISKIADHLIDLDLLCNLDHCL